MLIRYNKFDDYTRERIRFLENKGHIGYIRYLMLRRIPFEKLSSELIRLGLSGAEESDFLLYFEKVIYPILQKYKIGSYYKRYLKNKESERLTFTQTFGKSETHRQLFCETTKDLEIDHFFRNEVVTYYGSVQNVPLNDRNGQPVISTEKVPDWSEMLMHPKRHIIDGMLVDGKTPKMISDYLDQNYDVQLKATDISFYARAFFKVKRRDLERTIEDLDTERTKLQESLSIIRQADDSQMTIGEKTAALSTVKEKILQLDNQIKKLSGHYSEAAYNEGVLEFAQMREMFADVMLRSHRRFVTMDERSEDTTVPYLDKIVSMMGKATDKILSLEDTMKENSKKSIVEEMLEVVMPSLDRIEEDEKNAREEYAKTIDSSAAFTEEVEEDEILGMDEE